MIDFADALTEVRKDLTAGDVHIDTAMGNGGGRRKRTEEVAKEDGFVPPEGAQNAARRALEVRATKPPSQRGMTRIGIARARDISNGKSLPLDTVKRMKAFFDRHQSDKEGSTWDEQGKGWQAWQGWGGDAGYTWAKKIVAQHERAEKGMTATVAKAAPTGKTVWAWASVIEENGRHVIDHQGDVISEAELEKAFDRYMSESRDVGLMHDTMGHGRVTQGLVFTKELQQALGIDLGRTGALVKINVDDPEVQKRVASGELRELSIGGTGKRKKI